MTLEQRNELIINHIPLANKLAKQKFIKYKNKSFDEIRSAAYMGLVDAAVKFKININCSFYTYATIRISGEISDYFKKNKPHRQLNLDIGSSNDHVDYYNNLDLFDKAISFLNKNNQNIIKMYYLENKSMKEIGDFLDVSESRVSQMIGKLKVIMRKKMKTYSNIFIFALIVSVCNCCYAQNAIPVPLEDSKKISQINGEFDGVQKTELPEKYKDLVWNKWDTKNFIILSIDKKQGHYIKNEIENLKTNIICRWGLSDFDFSIPCKIICVDSKDLLSDLFKIDNIHYEVRKNEQGKITLNVIWLCYDDCKDISYFLSNICFDEIEQVKNKELPFYIKKGMCYLSKNISSIKKEIAELEAEKIDYPELISKNEKSLDKENLISFEKQSAVACLLFRKEFGQVNFINYLNNNDLRNFGSEDVKIINGVLDRYYKNLQSDLKDDKVPNDYLNIRRN